MPARPFLRTASKCQLIPSSGYENPPPVAEVKGSPQHVVIGFHLISEQIKQQADACDSPRSVLEPSVLCASSHHEQSRSPRSPRSVLGCLISGQESHRPVREGVGLGVVAAIKAEEARMPKPSQDLLMMSKPIAISVQNEYTGMRNRNVCEGRFVANAQAFYSEVTGGDDFDNFDVDDDPMTGVQESIFCAASPFSACCSLEYPTRDFLSVCFLCKCHLSHGKDVYMYKGDKAFCSAECRYQQIVIDEFKERQMAAANCYMGTSTQHSKAFAGASAAVA